MSNIGLFHGLPPDVQLAIISKLHLPALARLALTNFEWAQTISAAVDADEPWLAWRAVEMALHAGQGGPHAAIQEQELQEQRRTDLLEHVPHLGCDIVGTHLFQALVTLPTSIFSTRGERIYSAVIRLKPLLKVALNRHVHQLLSALCLRATPEEALRLITLVPEQLGPRYAETSEDCAFTDSTRDLWRSPSSTAFTMLRRSAWTFSLMVALHDVISDRVESSSWYIGSLIELLRKFSYTPTANAIVVLVQEGASCSVTAALYLRRSRAETMLTEEDDPDGHWDWDFESVVGRRKDCATLLARQVSEQPLPSVHWRPWQLITTIAGFLASEDSDALEAHDRDDRASTRYSELDSDDVDSSPAFYDMLWFPSVNRFLVAWTKAVNFPHIPPHWDLESRNAMLLGSIEICDTINSKHFENAMRSFVLTWVLKLTRAGEDTQEISQRILECL